MTSQKLSNPLGLFGLKSFHGFGILGILGGTIEPSLPCVLFGDKNVGKPLQKTISKLANSSKNIQKNIKNVPTGTHKKRQILFHQFLGKYTLFLTPHFFEGRMKIPSRTGTNFLKNYQGKRGREREIKFLEVV